MSLLREQRFSRIDGPDVLADLASRPVRAPLPEVTIGRLVGLDGAGTPLVDFPGNPAGRPLTALATAACQPESVGREVALLFVDGDPARPLVLGLLRAYDGEAKAEGDDAPPIEARLDGETVTLTAERELVLTCGKASITLTRAGKVLIRGAYLLSRSSGVNRIKGGSVQIN